MPTRAEIVLTNKPAKGSTFLNAAFSMIGVIPQKKMVASQRARVFPSIVNSKIYQPFGDNPLFRIIIFLKLIPGGGYGAFERERFPVRPAR